MLIVHRCQCGHPDLWHALDEKGQRTGACLGQCGCSKAAYGGPEVLPSWSAGMEPTRRETTVHEPGYRLVSGVRTCECEQCQTRYREAVREVAA
ncbi:hypothetical protein [Amycolatopsis aidingensis]|uniref:hypothetical protein n=1 Tax=Amycolatopsis aidingensis TaxID=2842453 RepID=UPI001C0C60F7|nr:hypothetical protein [Amycolatopsis aidingensis]